MKISEEWLFQKRVVGTKLDNYGFIYICRSEISTRNNL